MEELFKLYITEKMVAIAVPNSLIFLPSKHFYTDLILYLFEL